MGRIATQKVQGMGEHSQIGLLALELRGYSQSMPRHVLIEPYSAQMPFSELHRD
jgi:hypothetical protein